MRYTHENLRRWTLLTIIGAITLSFAASSTSAGEVRNSTTTVEPTAWQVLTHRPHLTGESFDQSEWRYDPEVSWYGPGFYGKRTACGLEYTKTLLGVAHRNLPCGTLIEFKWRGRSKVVPVIDRGPFVEGRQWDLSGGLCVYLDHCFTGPIYWRPVGKLVAPNTDSALRP